MIVINFKFIYYSIFYPIIQKQLPGMSINVLGPLSTGVQEIFLTGSTEAIPRVWFLIYGV